MRKTPINLARGKKDGQMISGMFALRMEVFMKIRELAKKNNVSFSEQLRQLVDKGVGETK